MARRAEGFAPALAGPAFRGDDQTIAHDPHFDSLTEPALLDQWLRYADATGISDPNQLCSHVQKHLCNYIVSTTGRFGNSRRDGSLPNWTLLSSVCGRHRRETVPRTRCH